MPEDKVEIKFTTTADTSGAEAAKKSVENVATAARSASPAVGEMAQHSSKLEKELGKAAPTIDSVGAKIFKGLNAPTASPIAIYFISRTNGKYNIL